MAIIWQKDTAHSRYEVRTHGASVRLYSNGVFHSQWNPKDPLKGSLWELLLLPVFFLPREQVRRVLVLGVGGGAVVRLLQQFAAPEHIVGVDIDPTHLEVARRFFGVRGVELVCADAKTFVQGHRESASHVEYDVIIDDLFGHRDGEAVRAFPADEAWCDGLLTLLAPEGLVVANFGSRRELLNSGWRARSPRRTVLAGWTAELPDYENCIGVFSRRGLSRAVLTDQTPPALNPTNPHRKLDVRLHSLR